VRARRGHSWGCHREQGEQTDPARRRLITTISGRGRSGLRGVRTIRNRRDSRALACGQCGIGGFRGGGRAGEIRGGGGRGGPSVAASFAGAGRRAVARDVG
jgi:hypothetical protein